jgi:hypothetical protein
MDADSVTQLSTAFIGLVGTIIGGGFGAAFMKYRLGAKRVEEVEAPTAAAKAFEIAMNVQSQLNDSVNANVNAMQKTIIVLQEQVAHLEKELRVRDDKIAELMNEIKLHEKDATIGRLEYEAEHRSPSEE